MRLRTKIFLVFAIYIGLLGAVVSGAIWRMSERPIALDSWSTTISNLASSLLGEDYDVVFVGPRLMIENGELTLAIEQIQIRRRADLQMLINEAKFVPNPEALWFGRNVLPRRLLIASIVLIGERQSDVRPRIPQAVTAAGFMGLLNLGWQNFDPVGTGGILRNLDYLEVQELYLLDHAQLRVSDNATSASIPFAQAKLLEDSAIRFDANDTRVLFFASVALPSDGGANKFELQAQYYFEPVLVDDDLILAGGELTLNLDSLRPKEYAGLIPELPVLEQMDFTMDITLEASLSPAGRMRYGTLTGDVRSGFWRMPEQDLLIEKGELDLDIDFLAQSVDIKRVEFIAENTDLLLSGQVAYARTSDTFLDAFSAQLSGDAFRLNFGRLSDSIIIGDAVSIAFRYDLSDRLLHVEQLLLQIKEGFLEIAGVIRAEPKGDFRLTAYGENIGLGNLRGIQITPVRARAVVNRFMKSGRLVSGNATVWRGALADANWWSNRQTIARAPAPDRRVQTEIMLTYADSTIEWLTGAPHLEQAEGTLRLTMDEIVIDLSAAVLRRPSHWDIDALASQQDMMRIHDGQFHMPNWRQADADANLTFAYEGAARVLAELLIHPSLAVLDVGHYAPETVQGQLIGKMRVGFPNIRAFDRANMYYDTQAHSTNLQMRLYDAYQLRADYLRAHSTPQEHIINGTAFLYDAKGQMELRYQSAQADGEAPIVLNWKGMFGPQDFVALKWPQLAERMEGQAEVDFSLRASATGVNSMHLDADLGAAVLKPMPLAYRKAAGLPARLQVDVHQSVEGKIRDVQVAYAAGADMLQGRVTLDETATKLLHADIAPIKLGDSYDAQIRFTPASEQRAHLDFTGNKFHLAGLPEWLAWVTDQSEASVLPDDMDFHAHVARVFGYGGVAFDTVRIEAQRRASRLEQLRLAADYSDGERMGIRIARDSETTRRLQGLVSNLGLLVSAIDNKTPLRNGELLLDVQLLDTPQIHSGTGLAYAALGQTRLQDFYITDVPILAQLLSLASLTGILSSLRGDGIYFQEWTNSFAYHPRDSLLGIVESVASGPAISITTEGLLDFRREEQTALRGTVVPANTVNAVLRRIPIFGRLIVGGEGEGVIGIRYTLLGSPEGKTNVSVNPLTIFTPSIIRRLFTFSP